ncbi:menaquinone biosynthesis family protein [Campylobacter insulaenigrae]|uniref:1,4-dihydroxy-6-naphtoate synthase n=1 Tax=Campylobacter insulaenigrae TaxID=260714 RepID=A0ABY3G4A2_9BACT|nr:menaquinone biosynthesis family protein [Campylobacter insulaenigrae]MCR6571422.1 menaquinone biosynthesis family protein [Campylobacter insulaenigrae]MCR6573080.1 menaquinone biosynthesis family protein [Campylobacter insulaenigrae]MCR6574533.1 menaquinone biosynthesis family protein [Campylobacter insulaenigrae]MCR6576124.1 menaquinone biosynthesis family protein [Campylobacter insulaenigrae]MCR6579157.1 menaquinone biosynthesis family protein [Campylobacter insulaenigrae]
MKKISVAHSPDADDIFMYMAIKFGWVGNNYKYNNIALDIQTLNEMALQNEFDVSAISFALYPLIASEYALLKTAVSFGEGYGPKLIRKKNKKLKPNFKVALSGMHTSNALIFRIKYPQARIIYKNFLEIEKAVLEDEVDAGVLIHESILDFDDSLCVEAEIWDIWQDLIKDDLPLPLGGMALRRSLPLNDAINIEKDLIKAVQLADHNKKILAPMLMERNLIRVNEQKLEIYLGLYANKNSINMSDRQYNAIDKLFELGYEHNFYDNLIKSRLYLIPDEYEKFRNS